MNHNPVNDTKDNQKAPRMPGPKLDTTVVCG